MSLEIKLKNQKYCDDCDYLHPYQHIIYARCRKSFRNNYIHKSKDGYHWIRPERCIKRETSANATEHAVIVIS